MSVKYTDAKRAFVLAILLAKEKEQNQEVSLEALIGITNDQAMEIAKVAIEMAHSQYTSTGNSQQFANAMRDDILACPNGKMHYIF